MAVDFSDMIDELKKEISDNLTKRISFTPIEPAKENHLKFKKEKDKKKFIFFIGMIILSIFLLISSFILIGINNKTLYEYEIKNNIKTDITFNDKEFSSVNESVNTYLASLIDYVNIKFSNNLLDHGSYNYNKNVTATLEILDANDENNIVFEKSDVLLKDNKGVFRGNSLNETNISIDYQKYNSMANIYAKKVNIPSLVRLKVNYSNEITTQQGIKNNIKQKVYIPLKVDTVDIIYDYDDIIKDKVTKDLNLDNVIIIMLGLSIILLMVGVVSASILINKNKNTLTVLEKKYKKIMDNYNNIIEVENCNFDKNMVTIDVKYFVDLIDAQQELHVPILCYTDKVTARTWFYIVTDKLLYKYELNKSDELI